MEGTVRLVENDRCEGAHDLWFAIVVVNLRQNIPPLSFSHRGRFHRVLRALRQSLRVVVGSRTPNGTSSADEDHGGRR